MVNQQELIELYHSGDMSPDQLVAFEKQLKLNPELNAESNLQSDIINGLKEVRKAELKSRLNAIDISGGWMEFAMQSTLVKSFGGVAVATLIGSGVYFIAEKEETIPTLHTAIEITEPQPQDIYSFEFILPETIEDESVNLISTSSSISLSETRGSNVVLDKKEEKNSDKKDKVVVPSFSAPTASLVEDENKFESSNLDKIPEVASSNDKEIDVSTENVKSLDVKYKYYDGKLFLKGDFDRAPYEILEINSPSGRRIYIKYLDKYYQVKTTDRLSNLPEVIDNKLIQELKLLKVNK